MIVICTHKSPDVLKVILKSIRENSTDNHKILVAETSRDQVSRCVAEEYNCLFTNSDLKYEVGAYRHAMRECPDEDEYFMFQDSIEILKFGWEDAYRQLSDGTKMVTVCGYPLAEDPCPDCGKNFFESTYGLNFPVEDAWAVGCNCFYISQKAKQSLESFGFHNIKAENKVDTYDTERIMGAVAHYSCGLEDVSKLLGYWLWDGTKYARDFGFTKYIYKHMKGRQ